MLKHSWMLPIILFLRAYRRSKICAKQIHTTLWGSLHWSCFWRTTLWLCETFCISVGILVAILDFSKSSTLKLIYNPHNWISWPWKHTLRHQNQCPTDLESKICLLFVFWQPSWIFLNSESSFQFITHILEFCGPWKHSLRPQNNLPNCSFKEHDMATLVFCSHLGSYLGFDR